MPIPPQTVRSRSYMNVAQSLAKLKLTPAKIALLEKNVELGAPMKDVFAASDVSRLTYYRWMSIG